MNRLSKEETELFKALLERAMDLMQRQMCGDFQLDKYIKKQEDRVGIVTEWFIHNNLEDDLGLLDIKDGYNDCSIETDWVLLEVLLRRLELM